MVKADRVLMDRAKRLMEARCGARLSTRSVIDAVLSEWIKKETEIANGSD